jgi:hypothetical protein
MNAIRQTYYVEEEEKHVLRALIYFDIFSYPLTATEVAEFAPVIINFSPHQFLENLVKRKVIFRFQDYYSLHDEPRLVERRVKGNALAERKLKTAKRFSRLISMFPFVRAVLLSGSISKGYMDAQSDIDYFIITEMNRLWVVRTLLALFRRVFLFNSHRNMCTNYFVDTDNLEIEEKNLFTAIELQTTKAMFGRTTFEKFYEANGWTFLFLPNSRINKVVTTDKTSFLKRALERLFSFKGMDEVNEWLMNKSKAYWIRRYSREVPSSEFEIAFRSTKGISKSHPQFFQKKVLEKYELKIRDFKINHGIDVLL